MRTKIQKYAKKKINSLYCVPNKLDILKISKKCVITKKIKCNINYGKSTKKKLQNVIFDFKICQNYLFDFLCDGHGRVIYVV